jgi:hypothetical protein
MIDRRDIDDRGHQAPVLELEHAIFGDLRRSFGALLARNWPDHEALNAMLPAGSRTVSGYPVRFIGQAGKMTAVDYEQQIWDSGRVPTRAGQWHDLFNAMIWSLFPNSKARLNALHVQAIIQDPDGPRSRLRDALTLIDECGIIIASRDATARHANLKHDWNTLFLNDRERWFVDRQPLIFGHGLYEQCLRPYLGLTAKSLHLTVSDEFFGLSLERQYQQLDQQLAQWLKSAGMAMTPADLMAFPLLGVPGWHHDNEDPGFYQNSGYFRPHRQ